jgi:hypothetical protein
MECQLFSSHNDVTRSDPSLFWYPKAAADVLAPSMVTSTSEYSLLLVGSFLLANAFISHFQDTNNIESLLRNSIAMFFLKISCPGGIWTRAFCSGGVCDVHCTGSSQLINYDESCVNNMISEKVHNDKRNLMFGTLACVSKIKNIALIL